jgi:hypothetical protein
MAKSNVNRASEIKKSLQQAADILNGNIHLEGIIDRSLIKEKDARIMEANFFEVELHQAFCKDEHKPLGSPTTSEDAAINTALDHHQATNHVTTVISSK